MSTDTTKLPVLVVDIDDVLHRYNHPHFCRHIYAETGVQIEYHEIVVPYLSDLLPAISVEREHELVHLVYRDELFWDDTPIEHSRRALAELSKRFCIIAVTARPESIRAQTEDWLNRHFPGVFSEFIFIGLKGSAENTTTKLEHAMRHGAYAMIDDARHHLSGCAEQGIKGVLFGQPWNEAEEQHPDFVRVVGWEMIEEALA